MVIPCALNAFLGVSTRAGFHNAILTDLGADLSIDPGFEVISLQSIRLARLREYGPGCTRGSLLVTAPLDAA